MKPSLPRRQFLRLAATAAALPAASRIAHAQVYPDRPVRIVVGIAAGGAADIIARLVAQWLSERLGQRFIVENRPGAFGKLAEQTVAAAAPDGYTLLYVTPPNVTDPLIHGEQKSSLIRDIAPVASIVRTPGIMEVNLSVPVKTVPEFIAYAKANPRKINMATPGPGSGPHLYGELFMMMTGVELVPVHYHGSGPALPDLIGNRVQVMFDIIVSSIEQIKAGKLRPLGVTTSTRIGLLPDVPSISDYVPGYEASGWQGLGAPKKTAQQVIDKLNREINVGLADRSLKARLASVGGQAFPGSAAEFGTFLTGETEKWGKVIRAADIKPD